jgi:rare lipoprotein A
MIAPSTAMSLRKCLSCFSRVALISTLAFSGCTSERSGEQGKQTPQATGSAASTKPSYKEVGEASWYGPGFQGNETANGETFDQNKMTAAHPSLPLGTKADVTNLENGKKVEVKINDRGPYAEDRAIDLSRAAAKKLDMEEDGTAKVKIEAKPNQQKTADGKSSKTE